MRKPVQPTSSTPTRRDVFVSVVAVVDHTIADIRETISRAHAVLSAAYTNFEIVLVDNGMDASQLVTVRDVLHEIPCVRVQRLSRHFAYDTAIFSGIESAIGDFVVVLEADRDPIENVTDIVSRLEAGSDIVQGISTGRGGGSPAERCGRSIFYWYNRRALGVVIPSRATYFTGFTRRSVNSLLSSDRQFRYLRHLMRHIGYSIEDFAYSPQGSGRSRGVMAGARDAVEMITSYSLRPLRIVAIGGVGVAALNLLYALYVLVTFLAADGVERGWTTTNLQLSVMFFFLFLFLAVVSEYIGRMLAEARREPAYFIMEELASDRLIADEGRRNIV